MSKIWHFQDWTCIPLWSILHFSKWGWAILNIGAWCFFEFLLIHTFLLFAFCRCEYELRWFHAGSWTLKNTVIWNFQDWTCIPLWSILRFSKWGWAILNIGAWCFFEFLLIYTFLLFAFCRCEYELRWFHAGSWGLKNTVRNICNVGQKLKYEKTTERKSEAEMRKKSVFLVLGKFDHEGIHVQSWFFQMKSKLEILIFSHETKTRILNRSQIMQGSCHYMHDILQSMM